VKRTRQGHSPRLATAPATERKLAERLRARRRSTSNASSTEMRRSAARGAASASRRRRRSLYGVPAADNVRAQVAGLWRRAAVARQRAASAGAMAARSEQRAALLPEALSRACLRLAAVQRRAQARHLASAALQDQYAGRLDAWLERSGELGQWPVFIDAVAAAIGLRSATVILLGAQRGEAVIAASDATARAAHDLEFVPGEGPAHLALTRGHGVQAADAALCGRWPQYGPAVARLGVQAVIAVPLQPPAGLGAVCGYDSQPSANPPRWPPARSLTLCR
jgi:hypothetical protein